ncbi:uncharacterized protein ABDE67_018362 [Symphorus nematophorus]
MIFLILVCVLGGLWETEAMSITGVSGEAITINCSHTYAFSNIKYFCKGACENKEILISSREKKNDSNEKYSISDEGNKFYVTISHLTEEDSGTYWCGIDRLGFDTYNKVVLSVIEGNMRYTDNDFSDLEQSIPNEEINTEASSSMKLVYIGVGLGVAVLALAMVLLIFFRHPSRDISTSSGEVHDTVYATPFCQNQDSHQNTSTANEDQETEGGTNNIFSSSSAQLQDVGRDQTDSIYSNVTVSSEPEIQPDSLFYSTVTYNKYTDCSTVTAHTAVITYSTIKSISTED